MTIEDGWVIFLHICSLSPFKFHGPASRTEGMSSVKGRALALRPKPERMVVVWEQEVWRWRLSGPCWLVNMSTSSNLLLLTYVTGNLVQCDHV